MSTSVSENTKPRRGVAAALAPVASEPLLVRISDACRLSGFSRSDLYRRATRNEVVFVKAGRMTLVDYASLKAAVSALPRAAINTTTWKIAPALLHRGEVSCRFRRRWHCSIP